MRTVCRHLLAPRILTLLVVASIAGCQTAPPTNSGTVWPAPPAQTPPPSTAPAASASSPVDRPLASQPLPIETRPPETRSYPSSPAAISGEAVTALMEQAAKDRAAGRLDLAAANLERAVRIEPRNYFVWSSLASVYLAQRLYPQAESVARKSTSLSRGNPHVEMANWRIIAKSLEAMGDSFGALQAEARVDELSRQLEADSSASAQ